MGELADTVRESRRRAESKPSPSTATAGQRRRSSAARSAAVSASNPHGRDYDELGLVGEHRVPRRRVGGLACVAEDVRAAGELYHLRQPVPRTEWWLDPLGEEHASARQPMHRVGGRLDRFPHLRHDPVAAVDGTERGGEGTNRLGDAGERSRIE